MKCVWDRLANEYDRMWVQKYSLVPTRQKVIEQIGQLFAKYDFLKLLDLGCGTGQLIDEILHLYPYLNCTGIDKSEHMIDKALARKNNARFFIFSAYLATKLFKKLMDQFPFVLVDEFKIKERFYMP